jgi:hypothetical protein
MAGNKGVVGSILYGSFEIIFTHKRTQLVNICQPLRLVSTVFFIHKGKVDKRSFEHFLSILRNIRYLWTYVEVSTIYSFYFKKHSLCTYIPN